MAKGALDDIARLKRQQCERREAKAAQVKPKLQKIAEAKASVVNVVNGSAKTPAQRSTKWRAKNADTNRQRARDGMRKTRAKAKV